MESCPEVSEDDLIQLAYLRDVEKDVLVDERHLPESARLESTAATTVDERLTFEFPEVVLHVTTGLLYPASAPSYELESIGYSLPQPAVTSLRASLAAIVAHASQSNNNTIANFLHAQQELQEFEHIQVVLQLIVETKVHVKAHRAVLAARPKSKAEIAAEADKPQIPRHLQEEEDIIDPTSLESLLRQSIPEICSTLPSAVTVLHIESVQRSNLVSRFLLHQHTLSKTLSSSSSSSASKSSLLRLVPHTLRRSVRTADEAISYITRPHLTFHGTETHRIPSIVRHGFLLPDDPSHDGVRCGSTYGRGIYSSPDAAFALSYTELGTRPRYYAGRKLIVCATLMGRARTVYAGEKLQQQQLRTTNAPSAADADSHVANCGREYVVFSAAQIVPCYVIHLDWGRDGGVAFGAAVPANPAVWSKGNNNVVAVREERAQMAPGDRKREKEATMARARKWFPYGFGPATGDRFVVEEVGDVSDDEEQYGDYQEVRRMEEESERLRETQGTMAFWEWADGEVKGDKKLDEFWRERNEWMKI